MSVTCRGTGGSGRSAKNPLTRFCSSTKPNAKHGASAAMKSAMKPPIDGHSRSKCLHGVMSGEGLRRGGGVVQLPNTRGHVLERSQDRLLCLSRQLRPPHLEHQLTDRCAPLAHQAFHIGE